MTEGKDRDCRSCGAPLKFARYLRDDGELGERIAGATDEDRHRLIHIARRLDATGGDDG